MGKSAYEKMFEDGSAFKPIKINQPTPESEKLKLNENTGTSNSNSNVKSEIDYSLYDNQMEEMRNQRIEEAKAKKMGTPIQNPIQTQQQPIIENKKVKELERRISILEQALQLVMETQTKLLKENS